MKVKLNYIISNNGDGSTSVRFVKTKEEEQYMMNFYKRHVEMGGG